MRKRKGRLWKFIRVKFGEAIYPGSLLARVNFCFVTIPVAILIYSEHIFSFQGNSCLNIPLCRREHYCKQTSRDHFHDSFVGTSTGAYDLKYIKAVLCDDEEEVALIEQAAFDLGYGPLVECTTITNASSQRAICRMFHSLYINLLN
jgi:hypothetical protein